MRKETIVDLRKVCLKKDESRKPLYAQKITHFFSIWIVKLIGDTGITPNQVTLLSVVSGLLAAAAFSTGSSLSSLLGALLVEIYYILDAVDGQLARVKKVSSATGAYFDYITNHIVQPVIFAGIGTGLYIRCGDFLYMIAGFSAAFGMMFMYLIYDVMYNVLYHNVSRGSSKTDTNNKTPRESKRSFFKRCFMILHQLCRYPTVMNIITAAVLLNLFIEFFNLSHSMVSLKALIIFYAFSLNIVWISKLAKFIRGKQLEI